MEKLLPPQLLPAVLHVTFLVFNWAVPNILAWVFIVAGVLVAFRARLPKIF